MKKFVSFALLLVGAALTQACGGARPPRSDEPVSPGTSVGAGTFATRPPAGAKIGVTATGQRAKPKFSPDFGGIPTSNDWWSSLLWQYTEDAPHSLPLYAHPLALRAGRHGLGLGYPDQPEVKKREYMYRYTEDLQVGLVGLDVPRTEVAGYSDWAVTASWPNELKLTFGHGLPFVYGERRGTKPVLVDVTRAEPHVFHRTDSAVGLSVDGHHYGLFGPPGSRWEQNGRQFRLDPGASGHFSVALLPDDARQTLEDFQRRAFAFVRNTRVDWSFDEATSHLTSRFTVEAELVERCPERASDCALVDEPPLALYRHQWLRTNAKTSELGYVSARGRMKLLAEGKSFETQLSVSTVLPVLPLTEAHSNGTIENLIDRVLDQPELFPVGLGEKPAHDAYWEGKSLGKLANLLHLADQLGADDQKARLLDALRTRLEDWFDGRAPRFFYYDEGWRSLMGFPDSYGSATQINDHHFHYGYFIMAAAAVARFDRAWADEWGPFVELLIRDAANLDRSDTRFPFLRYMDPYAGHSWANGPAQFLEGNNEEASSEDLNFSAAVLLWGALVDRKDLRDLGAFLYANQIEAVEQYWFDVDRAVFPKGFEHPAVAMVWGAGGKYDTWFDQDPTVIHGINFLPFTGASLYLGRRPDYVKRNFDVLLERSHGDITTWRDYIVMFLVTGDAERAREHFDRDRHFTPEFGNSLAYTLHWLEAWEELGTLDSSISADVITHAVFNKGKRRRHVAFNPSAEERVVRFSDGATLRVKARELALD